MNTHLQIIKIFLSAALTLIPLAATADYVCSCYVDLRYVEQGLVYQGQVETSNLNSSKYVCQSVYTGTTVADCYQQSSSTSSTSLAPSSSEDSFDLTDCVKQPKGIAEACLRAFPGEYNINPGQTEIMRDSCTRSALSVAVVNRCLKKIPIEKGQHWEPTYNRANCIDDLSADKKLSTPSRMVMRRC